MTPSLSRSLKECYYITFITLTEALPISSSSHIALFLKRLDVSKYTLHLYHAPIGIAMASYVLTHLDRIQPPTVYAYVECVSALMLCNLITGLAYLSHKRDSVSSLPLWLGLSISSASLISLNWAPGQALAFVPWYYGILLGCVQTLALAPGISRMAVTTVAGVWLGMTPGVSFLFSVACQTVLIAIAVAEAILRKAPFISHDTSYRTRSLARRIVPIISGTVSLALLVVGATLLLTYVGHSFMTRSIIYLGYYLAVLALYAAHIA